MGRPMYIEMKSHVIRSRLGLCAFVSQVEIGIRLTAWGRANFKDGWPHGEDVRRRSET